ncbi:NAD(P)/FAD-dependent oxidoreductase [Candidatus Woesearchaeota archaeon]|nr:NAD(P)/FAD-dependent oxidoreductase [Candidatus Woesearchaeota archaeon]
MIVIIGGGPIGCFVASLLAEKGLDVCVYEEHDSIGKPVQCTGIVTGKIKEVISLKDEFIVNRLSKVKVNSLNNSVDLELSEEIVLDRVGFDQYLAEKAASNGAKIVLNHKFTGIELGDAIFLDKEKDEIIKVKADKIIGADGPLSCVAKSSGIFGNREFYTGIQARIKGKFDSGSYETYFGSTCPDFFGWVVPESDEIARIGVASRDNAKEYFDSFLKSKGFSEEDIIDKQGGLIPIYDKKVIVQKNNIFLVGDAACHVKATTGGGLVPGLKAASILADCIINDKNYEKELRKLNKEMRIHLKARKMLNNFSDKDYDKLINLVNNEKIKNILKENNRDSPFSILKKVIFAEPKLLLYIKNFTSIFS